MYYYNSTEFTCVYYFLNREQIHQNAIETFIIGNFTSENNISFSQTQLICAYLSHKHLKMIKINRESNGKNHK